MSLILNMKCKSIELKNRSDYIPTITTHKNMKENDTRIVTTSYYHNCPFCWDKPYKKTFDKTEEQPSLTITDIYLPINAKSFNTGSSLEKWSKKRPRLKSSKHKKTLQSETSIKIFSYDNSGYDDFESDDSDRNNNDFSVNYDENYDNDDISKDEEEEIDLDILKLILESKNYDEEKSKEYAKQSSKRKHKKKLQNTKSADEKKKKTKSKLRRTKTISFSLSKPPSPETVQVIRVDVTSNYSYVEVEKGSSCKSDIDESFCEFDLKGNEYKRLSKDDNISEESIDVDDGNFGVSCQKLILTARD